MLDPLFPVALFCGPLAFAVLLRVEANRNTKSLWPQFTSIILALPAAWGMTYWVLLVAIILLGEGMAEAGFLQTTILSVTVAVLTLIASYCGAALRRRKRISSLN